MSVLREMSGDVSGRTATEADDVTAGYPPARSAWWTVSVLMFLYIFSFLDRQIINLMVDDIKRTLGISDFQISLLQGFSFAIFFAVLGLPLGWATDRFSRRKVIFGGLVVWSLAASACGLARNFVQLLFSRFALGAGEASLTPSAYSLIGDSFPHDRRAIAMSVFTVGAGFGVAISLMAGGAIIHAVPETGMTFPFVGHLEGWQVVFIVTGLPCLLVSWIVFTIRDPGRRERTSDKTSPLAALKFMSGHKRFFVCHFLGFSLLSLCHYGMAMWTPAHLHRNYGWDALQIGGALAFINGVICTIGAVGLGWFADYWFRRGKTDIHVRMFIYGGLLQVIFIVLSMAIPNAWSCLGFISLILAMAPYNGVAVTAIQIMTPNQFRGQVTALYLLLHTSLGIGLGPSVVAAITDFGFHDNLMVGWSIASAFIIVIPISVVLLGFALKPLRQHVLSLK